LAGRGYNTIDFAGLDVLTGSKGAALAGAKAIGFSQEEMTRAGGL